MAGAAAADWSGGQSARLGHHAARVLAGAVVAVVLLAVFPLPPDSPAAYAVPAALAVVVLVAWFLLRRHDRSLCEACLRAMPLDPSARAQRLRTRFAVVHLGANRAAVAGYLAVLLGSHALLFQGSVVARLVWAAVQCSMLYLVAAYSTHRALQPWCPWCSEGGGGEEVVDRPSPSPVGGSRGR